jgi:hypothetical protein
MVHQYLTSAPLKLGQPRRVCSYVAWVESFCLPNIVQPKLGCLPRLILIDHVFEPFPQERVSTLYSQLQHMRCLLRNMQTVPQRTDGQLRPPHCLAALPEISVGCQEI